MNRYLFQLWLSFEDSKCNRQMDLDQEIKKVDPALPDWACTKRQYKQKKLRRETPFAFIIMYKLETLTSNFLIWDWTPGTESRGAVKSYYWLKFGSNWKLQDINVFHDYFTFNWHCLPHTLPGHLSFMTRKTRIIFSSRYATVSFTTHVAVNSI